jgi:hypothetical protein
MALSITSKLDAINWMLSSVGEAPINQLGGATTVDADVAEQTLDEISRQVQSIGWHFNTEKHYPLVRANDKRISITSDIVRVDVSKFDYLNIDVVQRGDYLYDKKNHTYEFDYDLEADLVKLVDWDYLPQPFRTYITTKASRVFQTKVVGSESLANQLATDEASAFAALREYEADTGDYSVFDNYDVASVLDR